MNPAGPARSQAARSNERPGFRTGYWLVPGSVYNVWAQLGQAVPVGADSLLIIYSW